MPYQCIVVQPAMIINENEYSDEYKYSSRYLYHEPFHFLYINEGDDLEGLFQMDYERDCDYHNILFEHTRLLVQDTEWNINTFGERAITYISKQDLIFFNTDLLEYMLEQKVADQLYRQQVTFWISKVFLFRNNYGRNPMSSTLAFIFYKINLKSLTNI
jgi:hypothetical protein